MATPIAGLASMTIQAKARKAVVSHRYGDARRRVEYSDKRRELATGASKAAATTRPGAHAHRRGIRSAPRDTTASAARMRSGGRICATLAETDWPITIAAVPAVRAATATIVAMAPVRPPGRTTITAVQASSPPAKASCG